MAAKSKVSTKPVVVLVDSDTEDDNVVLNLKNENEKLKNENEQLIENMTAILDTLYSAGEGENEYDLLGDSGDIVEKIDKLMEISENYNEIEKENEDLKYRLDLLENTAG